MKSLKPKLTAKKKGRKVELPETTIKIGYTKYEIQVWDKMTATSNEAYGEFFERQMAIGIDTNQNGIQLVNTFLHEIMHGVIYQYGMKLDGDADQREETLVNVITNGMTSVYVDNPWLLPWIQQQLKNGED